MMNSKNKLILPILFAIVLIVAGSLVWMYQYKKHFPVISIPDTSLSGSIHPIQNPQIGSSGLSIMIPNNIEEYKQKMTNFVQIDGKDPLKTEVFVKKNIPIVYTGDPQRASAELAAQQFTTGGGPEKVLVNYFKVQSGTAYIVLNIDEDGRAGVSVSIAIIHPVVEKTLLQFTGIQHVVFGYAIGDKQIIQ